VELLRARCQRGPIDRASCLCLCSAQRLDQAFDRGFGFFLTMYSLESDRLLTENDVVGLASPLPVLVMSVCHCIRRLVSFASVVSGGISDVAAIDGGGDGVTS